MIRMLRPALVSLALALAASAGLTTAGCAGSGQDAQGPEDASGLPAWDAHARELFDDNIDAAAVGLTMEGPAPRSDPYLRERAQTADVVARVRISTVTVDSIGDESTYHLGIQIGYPPLVKPQLPDQTFELIIRSTSRASGIAKAFDARLRGLTFVGFIRRFAGEGGEPEIHWHLAPDTPETAAAVKEAVALGELSAP
ncbi:MAG: cobalamin ABC transporter substrate-binding protein [Polyangiaceae bacterium]|nr:cobalamin ABC transporter substrate-binding protein [Polyangiaceae bacterium]